MQNPGLQASNPRLTIKRVNDHTEKMTLTVNGDPMQVPMGCSVADLVALMALDTRKLAVERNLEIVPRSQYATTRLHANDQLEIVQFVGGG